VLKNSVWTDFFAESGYETWFVGGEEFDYVVADRMGSPQGSHQKRPTVVTSMAGFQVTLIGRFWVTPEALVVDRGSGLRPFRPRLPTRGFRTARVLCQK
jgi:hypothetical protein